MPPRVLTVDDVLDLRAYERVREAYRRRVMAHKRLRRVPLGPIMTVVFESLDTVRFQIHEMVRAERMLSDEAIKEEVDIYNRLLPEPGELSGTLFIELTSEQDLRHWLPLLVGIEHSVRFEIGAPQDQLAVGSVPEQAHAEALTREEVTPAVHYLRFPFPPEAVDRLAGGPAALAVRHPAYEAAAPLSQATRQELVLDLRGQTELMPLS